MRASQLFKSDSFFKDPSFVPSPKGGALTTAVIQRCDQLLPRCPREFYQDNPWGQFFDACFFEGYGGSPQTWAWRAKSQFEQIRLFCIWRVLGQLSWWKHEDKVAFAAWMLSQVVSEVPKHVPAPKKG